MARTKISSKRSTKVNLKTDICLKTELEEDRDFKANIYQQLIDLQPFLAEDSQVAVAIQVSPPKADELDGKAEYALKLTANIGDVRLESEGRDHDRYRALTLAKQKLLFQLDTLHTIDSRERNAHIRALTRGELTLH